MQKQTQTENVVCVYDKETNRLIAIIKRDSVSGKHLIHLTTEADTSEIATLINPDHMAI